MVAADLDAPTAVGPAVTALAPPLSRRGTRCTSSPLINFRTTGASSNTPSRPSPSTPLSASFSRRNSPRC